MFSGTVVSDSAKDYECYKIHCAADYDHFDLENWKWDWPGAEHIIDECFIVYMHKEDQDWELICKKILFTTKACNAC